MKPRVIVRLFSDLHMEFGKYRITPLPNDADTILILAGDLGEGGKPREFIEREATNFKYVLYVLGNHEFYKKEYHETIAYWKEREAEIDNLFVLHNEVFEVEGARFIGTTLWTGLNNGNWHDMTVAQSVMLDFSRIKIITPGCTKMHPHKKKLMGRTLLPQDTIDFHNEAMAFLDTELSKDFDGTTNVITHHSPSMFLLEDTYRDSNLNHAFHANCDRLFTEYDIDNWFYGHTHHAQQKTLGVTNVYSNPRGYTGYENPKELGFDHEFWLDL